MKFLLILLAMMMISCATPMDPADNNRICGTWILREPILEIDLIDRIVIKYER